MHIVGITIGYKNESFISHDNMVTILMLAIKKKITIKIPISEHLNLLAQNLDLFKNHNRYSTPFYVSYLYCRI